MQFKLNYFLFFLFRILLARRRTLNIRFYYSTSKKAQYEFVHTVFTYSRIEKNQAHWNDQERNCIGPDDDRENYYVALRRQSHLKSRWCRCIGRLHRLGKSAEISGKPYDDELSKKILSSKCPNESHEKLSRDRFVWQQ